MYIKILKSKNKLQLIDNDSVVFDFSCVLGKNSGRKLKKDDMKTPEGKYKVVVKNPKSEYFLSLGLDYPNQQDIVDGLKQGIIDQETHDNLLNLKKQDNFTDWSSALGGTIYIHGEGDNNKEYTQGCLKLSSSDMQKLYEKVELNTPVFIEN